MTLSPLVAAVPGGEKRGRGGNREIRFPNCYVTRPVVGRLKFWRDKLGFRALGWFVNVQENGFFFLKRNMNLNIQAKIYSATLIFV